MSNPFFSGDEDQAVQDFLSRGYFIFPIADHFSLEQIRQKLYHRALAFLPTVDRPTMADFFDYTHKLIAVEQLNDLRVDLISHLAQDPETRPLVYSLAKKYLDWIVGNELAMQRSCNLSIQLPDDNSSLLPLHSDVWSGNSPYEVVCWLPLVDCYCTKSMFLLPRSASNEVYANFRDYSQMTAEEFYQSIQEKLVWFEVPYGSGVIFSHAMPHGNRVNQEPTTRWTINVRFKSLLSPYGYKGLGESFLPVTLRPATRIGYSYKKPEVSAQFSEVV